VYRILDVGVAQGDLAVKTQAVGSSKPGAGLPGYFDEVLISGEAGVAKPDRHAFEILLTMLKSAPDNTLMIDDRLATDIQGARNAEMRAVWINRSGKAANGIIRLDWNISSLDELLTILGSERWGGTASVSPALKNK
jgi:phosphoglycolate phosphatase-like HAD superfamily hydrolase